jgi:hypothetical protein
MLKCRGFPGGSRETTSRSDADLEHARSSARAVPLPLVDPTADKPSPPARRSPSDTEV